MRKFSNFHVIHLLGLTSLIAYIILMVYSWDDVQVSIYLFLGVMGTVWACLFFLHKACQSISFSKDSLPVLSIICWAILFRIVGIMGESILEDDHYRFLWDGWVFAEKGTPYHAAPIDFFGDESVPDEMQIILDNINHPDVATIYSPTLQYTFLLSYWVYPANLLPFKLILLLADIITIWMLFRYSKNIYWILYAWCPLIIKETSFTAHPDSLGVVFLVASLVFLSNKRYSFSLITISLSLACKIFALILIPFLLIKTPVRYWWITPATLVLLYSPFFFTGDFRGEQGMQAFLIYWEFNSFGFALLAMMLPYQIAKFVGLGLFTLFYGWIFWKEIHTPSETIPRFDWLYGMFFFFSPVINAWYLLWLLPFVVYYPSRWGWVAMAAVTLSYINGNSMPNSDLLGYNHPVWLRPVEFGFVIFALLFDLISRYGFGLSDR